MPHRRPACAARGLGTVRAVVLAHHKRAVTTPAGRTSRPPVGHIGSPAALGRLRDAPICPNWGIALRDLPDRRDDLLP